MKETGTLNDYLAECGYERNDNNIKNNMRTVGMTRDEYFELLKQS